MSDKDRVAALEAEVVRLRAERDEEHCSRLAIVARLTPACEMLIARANEEWPREVFNVLTGNGAHVPKVRRDIADDLEAERAANVLYGAQVTTLTEQRDLCATEAERLRAALEGVRVGHHCRDCSIWYYFDRGAVGGTGHVPGQHHPSCRVWLALAAPSAATQVLSERDERVAGFAAGRERALVYRELREGALDGQLAERDERVRRKALEEAARLFDSDNAASANAWIARAIRALAEVKP